MRQGLTDGHLLHEPVVLEVEIQKFRLGSSVNRDGLGILRQLVDGLSLGDRVKRQVLSFVGLSYLMAEQTACQTDAVGQLHRFGLEFVLLELHTHQIIAGHQTVVKRYVRHVLHGVEELEGLIQDRLFLLQPGKHPIGLRHLLQHVPFADLLFEFRSRDTEFSQTVRIHDLSAPEQRLHGTQLSRHTPFHHFHLRAEFKIRIIGLSDDGQQFECLLEEVTRAAF